MLEYLLVVKTRFGQVRGRLGRVLGFAGLLPGIWITLKGVGRQI